MSEDHTAEREAFEAWYSAEDQETDDPERAYELTEEGMNELTKYCVWQGWQARAATPAQPDTHPTTGEPMGTDAQEATAWKLAAENLERENAALRDALKKANSQAEHFEREWYLHGDALEAFLCRHSTLERVCGDAHSSGN